MKRMLTIALLIALLTAICAPALAATTKFPKGVDPQQAGHPAHLVAVYGERKAKQILSSYGTPQLYSVSSNDGLLPVDGDRDGSLTRPFILGATPASKYFVGCYLVTMTILYKVHAISTVSATLTQLSVYLCNSAGVADTSKTYTMYV